MDISVAQQEKLIDAMVQFSLRVLEGKNCDVQETAALPQILGILFCKEMLEAKVVPFTCCGDLKPQQWTL